MEFGLLRPLEVRSEGAVIGVSRGKERALLAALLLRANETVLIGDLAAAVWGELPPPSAEMTVRNYVKRLRQVLGETGGSRILTRPGGYSVRVEAGELDVARFEGLASEVRAAKQAGQWEQVSRQARAALSLWRGDPLVGELGVEPGSEMRDLHQRILAADPSLALPAPARHREARSRRVAPRQLPAAVGCFTGRQAELAMLTSMLEAGAGAPTMVISAVSGTAGVGKTAIAVQWAYQVAERFPDGQLYVNLRGYDPAEPVPAADALAGLLQSLGVPGADIPDGVEERSRLYRSRLAGLRMLVLLDNARDSGQVRPLLPGDPGCAAVVTSRDTLAGLVAVDGARRLDLDVLPLADAVVLLRSLIGGRADHDPEATAEFAGLCARLPLALRIAAELALARRAVPLRELVAELVNARLDCLDAGDEHADIRAVLSWSYCQLPVSVARVFALMGSHPGDDLDAHAAALADSTAEQARRALSQLHRANLIQVSEPGRYAMHDPLRAYAREQDLLSFDPQPLTRLFDHYLAAAAAAMDLMFPAGTRRRPRIAAGAAVAPAMASPGEARAWLDQERTNLVMVVTHCAGHGWDRHPAALAATLQHYLIHGSHLPEAETLCGHALQVARQCGDLAAEASALNGLGSISNMKGRPRDAAGWKLLPRGNGRLRGCRGPPRCWPIRCPAWRTSRSDRGASMRHRGICSWLCRSSATRRMTTGRLKR